MLSNKGIHDTTKLGSSVVQEFKINQRRILIDSLEIGIPAPEQMIALGERQLPNGDRVGQLLNSKTLNYKKFTPHRDGLFCERIFGPVQSFVCACGKKKESIQNKSRHKGIVKANLLPSPQKSESIQNDRYTQPSSALFVRTANNAPVTPQTEAPFCPKCQVEYISKNVRRHRLGYIKLFAPVTHIWYLKGRPSYLSLFLGKRKKAITSLAYCNAYLVEQVYSDLETQNLLKNTNRSVSAPLRKDNVKIWQNTDSNDPSSKRYKDQPAKDLEKPLFSTRDNFHLDLPLLSKPSEMVSFDLMNTGNEKSHRNHLYKNRQNFKNQINFKNSGEESFLNLLIQLFPETLRSSSLPNSKEKTQRSLRAILPEFESKVEQDKSSYPVVLYSNFFKQMKEANIDRYMVTNLKKKFAKQGVQISKLAAKGLRYKVSTRLEGIKYFVETACSTTNRNFVHTNLLSIGRGQTKISPIPYIRAQALPFLPSLICPFHLRDCLISFLQSLPDAEDIPIPIYCKTPRRYPLRDVHKFLAELRSTNTQDKAERLTSDSIIRFIGLSKQASRPANPAIMSYSGILQLSSALSNHKNSKDKGAPFKLDSKKVRYPRTGRYTERLQKPSGYLQNKSPLYPTSFLKNEHRCIVVHKPRSQNLFSQIKGNVFAPVNSENQNCAFPVLNERNRVYSVNHLSVIRRKRWGKKKVFADTRTRIKERIFTPNGFSIGKENNKTLYNQTVKDFSSIYLDKNGNNALALYTTALFARVPERQMEVHKISPKLALVPLSLRFLTGSSLIRNRFITSYSSKASYTPSKGLLLNSKRPTNELLDPEWGSADLLTPIQLVRRETKLSLRGVLLSTFFNIIRAGLTELSLPFKPLQITGIKQVGFRSQRKQTVSSPNSEKTITSNKTFLGFKVPELVLPEVKTKYKPSLYKNDFWIRKQTNPSLYAKKITCLSFSKKKEFKYKYKIRRFTYMYVPTLLYARQLHFDKNKVNSYDLWFGLNELRYKYRSGLQLKLPSKTNAEARIYNASDTEVCDTFSKGELKQNKVLLRVPFKGQYQNVLNSDFRNLLFRKKIDTYQARLLHIVFGALPKNICFKELTRYIQSDYKNKVIRACKNGVMQKQSYARHSNGSTSFLYKLRFGTHLPKKQFPFGCTYLLTKDQQESKQDKVYKNNTTEKLKGKGVQTFTDVGLAKFGKVQQYFGVPEQVLSELDLGLPKQSFRSNINIQTKQITKQITCKNVSYAKTPFLQRMPSLNKTKFCYVTPKRSYVKTKLCKNEVFATHGISFATSTPLGSETISNWHTNGAKEILLYTGGGALESLLKRFNTSLFCQFLLGEVQILRKHYKDQIVAEHNKNKIVAEQLQKQSFCISFDPLYKGLQKRINAKYDWLARKNGINTHNKTLPLSNGNIATEHTLDHKEQHLGLKYVVTEKSANLFCRRIYRTTRRLKIVQLLMTSKRRPEWMMISVLPVLPPDLRPVLQMGDNLIVASDLNTLYQRVIYRNNRHYKGRFLDFHFVSSIHRLVQDAVDRLIENGKGGSTPFLTPGGRPLLSLSDILKGKRGRFRFNLLGKRVDFSGRSVIVVDPNLKIHECGLPREMALELYKYLLIRQLLLQKRVSSIVNAKKLIKQRQPFIWDILRQIIYYHPLLLNRAPTLHRLGIQAFQPKLVLGNAILLHPLVCAGFNADFDGDQMGVHLPLSPQARAEAWDLLWSRNNLLSPATGQPILLPSQDMVLGFYYMTSLLPYGTTNKASLSYRFTDKNEEIKKTSSPFSHLLPRRQTKRLSTKTNFATLNLVAGTNPSLGMSARSLIKSSYSSGFSRESKNKIQEVVVHVFSDKSQILHAYQNKQIDIHTPIWLKWTGKAENGEKSQIPLEIRIDTFGDRTQIYSTHQSKNKMFKGVSTCFFSCHIRTTVGRVLVNNLINKNY